MADPNLTLFGQLSAVLTGFPLARVAPSIDPIGLPQQFLTFISGQPAQAPVLQQLLTVYAGIAQQQPDLAQQAPLVQQQVMDDATLAPLARRIIRLWYLGIWYQDEPPAPDDGPVGQVLSMNAYTGGLAWDAAQAHPMGYSEMHYGYWSGTPGPVQTLTSPGA